MADTVGAAQAIGQQAANYITTPPPDSVVDADTAELQQEWDAAGKAGKPFLFDKEPYDPADAGPAPVVNSNPNPVSMPGVSSEINVPPPPPLHVQAAQGMMEALSKSNGAPGDWAKAAVSGVTAALASGNVGRVAPGQGWLHGVTQAAANAQDQRGAKESQARDQQFKQQELDLQKQKQTNEQGNFDKDYQLRVSENARQQAESYQRLAEHDYRMTQLTDAHNRNNFELMKDEVQFRQGNLDRENALKEAGATPLKINGQETPEFDDLGAAAKYAKDNSADVIAGQNGHNTRYEMGADGKYRIYEVPDTGVKEFTLVNADGTKQKVTATPQGFLAMQDKVADIKLKEAGASKDYAQASKDWDEYKDSNTAKAARKELNDNGGSYEKLSPGARDALTPEAQKGYLLALSKQNASLGAMKKDPAYAALVTDANGTVDENSTEYKDLEKKYHVDEANEDVADSYDELRQLRHGYHAPGSPEANPTPTAPAAAPVEQLTPAQKQFQDDQTAQADAQKKQEQDSQRAHNERPAEQPVISVGMGATSANPAFNDAEKYISAHKELTGPQRAEIRQQYAKTNQPANSKLPQPPQKGATINAQQFKPYLDAAGGDVGKAKQAALAAGWVAPQAQ
jgi:hypothetical protein